METWIVPVLASILTGAAVQLINLRKSRSEADLNEVQRAEITAKMALEFAEEKDAFYRIRLGLLEQDKRELGERVQCLEKTIEDLKAEVIDLRKRIG